MDEIRQKLQEQIAATHRFIDFNRYLMRNPNTSLSEYDEYSNGSPAVQKELRKQHRDTSLEDLAKGQRNLARLEAAMGVLEKME
jgi:heme oxygenase